MPISIAPRTKARFLAALIAAVLAGAGIGAAEAQQRQPQQVGNIRITDSTGAREVRLPISKSLIIELPADARDILVSNPQIANAIIRSPRRIFIIGTGVGSTNVFFFGDNGQQIASIDIVVERDLEGLNRTLRRMFPNTGIRAEGIGENVILSGQVNSAADAMTAVQVAERFVGQLSSTAQTTSTGGSQNGQGAAGQGQAGGGQQSTSGAGGANTGGSRIINALTIAGREQVQVRVIVAEMDRRAIQQLGVNLSGNWQIGGNQIQFNQVNPFPITPGTPGTVLPQPVGIGTPGSMVNAILPGNLNTTVQLRTLEQTGLIRTLAEPSLTAISGEQASFLAGGEFPVPVSRDRDGNVILEYKQFGVALAITPVVLSEGRISIRTRTEVSEIDPNAGFTGAGGFVIPGLAVRRAESTLELPSGGTIVMAGLIRDQTRRVASGVPGLRRLPILGRLFSSQDFLSQQTELVVLITPFVVNPVVRRDIALPTDGFVNATDPEALLFGRLNQIYGTRGQQVRDRPNGRFGFIIE